MKSHMFTHHDLDPRRLIGKLNENAAYKQFKNESFAGSTSRDWRCKQPKIILFVKETNASLKTRLSGGVTKHLMIILT